MGEYLELVSVNIWHIVITIANLLILFLLIKKFLFKPVQKILDERKNQVEKIYDDAKAAREAAEQDKKEYSERLKNADSEAVEIVRQATDRAAAAEEEIMDEANKKAEFMMKKADESIELERKRAANEIKNQISDISVTIAESVVGREISADDHRALIDSFIEDIGGDGDE